MLRRGSTIAVAAVAAASATATLMPTSASATFAGTQNGLIAYVVRASTAATGDIYLVKPNGDGKTNLTKSPLVDDESPAWSASGKWIVWSRRGDIWKMRADGTQKTRLTNTTTVSDITPSFSPSGARIVWERGSVLATMRSDGTSKQLIGGGMYGNDPEWSPDGHWIAYWRLEGSANELFKVRPTGAGQTALPDPANARSEDPDWSPDGQFIAYTRFSNDTEPDVGLCELPDMTNCDQPQSVGGVNEVQPAWSPDQTLLVYVQTSSLTAGPSSLRTTVLQSPTAGGTKILGSKKLISDPAWQPIP